MRITASPCVSNRPTWRANPAGSFSPGTTKTGSAHEQTNIQIESPASLESLRDALRQFASDRDWDQFHSPKNLAIALSVEAAELLEHFPVDAGG